MIICLNKFMKNSFHSNIFPTASLFCLFSRTWIAMQVPSLEVILGTLEQEENQRLIFLGKKVAF